MFNEAAENLTVDDLINFGKFLGMLEAYGWKTKEELEPDQRATVQGVLDQFSPALNETMGTLLFLMEIERMLSKASGILGL